MKNNKVLTLAALVLSAYAINQSSDITRKQDTPPVAESLLNYSASLDLNFIEFRNHREINRSIGFNSEKKVQLEEDLSDYRTKNKIETIEQAIDYSLDFVGRSLDFRLNYFFGKKGSDYFAFTREVKVTDCVDYAFLFDQTFKYVVSVLNLQASSQVMRSDGFIFGQRVDYHDWVRITDSRTGRQHFICPTFSDYGINPNLEGKIK